MNTPFIATRAIFLTDDGKVCDEKSPDKATLLVGVNGKIPRERAQELGLVKEGKPTTAAGRKNATRGGD